MSAEISRKLCPISVSLKEFYEPRLKSLGITYTHQTRLFKDGTSFLLTNNPQYLEHFIDKKYALPGYDIYNKSGMHLWSGITGLQQYDNQVMDMKNLFNIDHQIAIVYVENNYTDIFALGTTSQRPEMVNFYINHKNLIDNLFMEYKDKFDCELDMLNKSGFIFPSRPKGFVKKKEEAKIFQHLTEREIACLHLLSQGKTAKMIAKTMAISHRTVERHIDNVREKFGLRHKYEILNKFREHVSHEL